jgi:NAD(P)-dependent dehydrogenase (short-subunit alcohol dehydrogenase family)
MVSLNGKVALITGSTRGIGETTARLFAAGGARVVVTGRNRDRGALIAKSIESNGDDATFVQADISTEAAVAELIAATVRRYGRIDCLVNNAAPTDVMEGQAGRLTDVDWGQFEQIIRVGLFSAVWACRYAIPHMQRQGCGSIVNISSLAAIRGLPGVAAYTCAKGALSALTRQVALDYSRDQIRANTVLVGVIVNELSAPMMAVPGLERALRDMHLTRFGDNEDVARAVAYLAGDDSGFLTGTELRVDGGASINGGLPRNVIDSVLGEEPATASP